MFARFDRMTKAFTRCGREIAIAVREGGAYPKYNPRLRIAIQNARGVNMPKDRIEAAIKRASSKDEKGFEHLLYEAYAPYGIALMIECATDNSTRTVASVRHILTKAGGSLGASGSVAFLFERKGVFKIPSERIQNPDDFELELIDHGLEDMHLEENEYVIYAPFTEFGQMQKALEEKGIEATSTKLHYIPLARKTLSEEYAKEVLEVIENLEADDDVQSVYHNLE